MELLYAFLLASLILLHPCVFGGSGCIANNSTYSFCQIIGWTEWANCHSSCMGSLSVRNIMVCCVPNVTKDVCFSRCNISNTVISKEYGKIKYHYIIYVCCSLCRGQQPFFLFTECNNIWRKAFFGNGK